MLTEFKPVYSTEQSSQSGAAGTCGSMAVANGDHPVAIRDPRP